MIMKHRVRLTESDLHRIVKESVKKILKENGYGFDWGNGNGAQRNQGGSFGGSDLDISRDREKYYKEQEAQRRQESQVNYRDWCYQNYDLCMSVCPGYMNGGEYYKAYKCCHG